MLDAAMRRLVDPPLGRLARGVATLGVPANAITLAGLAIGLAAIPLLALESYAGALVAIGLNRLADGLDGAVARCQAPSDLGGYLDIVADFVFYAAVPFGFALARPENAVPAAFLILSFVGTGSAFLAYAVMAAKRGLADPAPVRRSLHYLGGLTEGTETIGAFVLFCLWPAAFPALAYAFGALCWVTTISRVAAAWRAFGR